MDETALQIAEGQHSTVDGGLGEWMLTVFQLFLVPQSLACQLENHRNET